MIADIIPLTRLPKTLGVFSYTVPLEIQNSITAGHLVSIPFRKKEILGIVTEIRETTRQTEELLQLSKLSCATPLIHKIELQWLARQAKLHGVHESIFVKMFLPPLQKKKLSLVETASREILLSTKNLSAKKQIREYHYYRAVEEQKLALNSIVKKPTLIIVPEQFHINKIEKQLENISSEIIIWHHALTQKQRFTNWFNIQNGKWQVIIGTRSALWLPYLPYLKNIIIDSEQSQQHKSWDQWPRFHAKDIAKELSDIYGLEYHEMSYSPSFSSFFYVRKKKMDGVLWPLNKITGEINGKITGEEQNKLTKKYESAVKLETLLTQKIQPEIAQLTNQPGTTAILHESIEDAIIDDNKKDIALILNRRGFSSSIICADCGAEPLCHSCSLPFIYSSAENKMICFYCKKNEPMTLTCSKCGSTLLKLLGVGLERVIKHVKNLLAEKTKRIIVQIESGVKPNLPDDQPWLIVGTDAALPHIRWHRTGLIALLDIDSELSWPEYMATETAWHRVQEMQFYKRADTRLILQTRRPDHLLFHCLLLPERIYRTELNYRQKTNYPPYVGLTRYLTGDKEQAAAYVKAQNLAINIKTALTKCEKTAIVCDPVPLHPAYVKGAYWHAIIVKLNVQTWQSDTIEINKQLTGEWKVDPNPIRLLQW